MGVVTDDAQDGGREYEEWLGDGFEHGEPDLVEVVGVSVDVGHDRGAVEDCAAYLVEDVEGVAGEDRSVVLEREFFACVLHWSVPFVVVVSAARRWAAACTSSSSTWG